LLVDCTEEPNLRILKHWLNCGHTLFLHPVIPLASVYHLDSLYFTKFMVWASEQWMGYDIWERHDCKFRV